MKNIINKVIIIYIILALVLAAANTTFAAYTIKNGEKEYNLEIVKESSDINLTDKNIEISKAIKNVDVNKKEITLEVKVKNNIKDGGDGAFEDTEVFIMVDENLVNESNNEEYIGNIKTLIDKILKYDSKTKVGIIGIKGTLDSYEITEDGRKVRLQDDEGYIPGSADNAEVIISPSNNLEEISNSLNNMNSQKKNYSVNLQAAVRLANNSFSNNCNKILISTYGRTPRISIGTASIFQASGPTEEEIRISAEYYLNEIVANTKNEMLTLKDNKVSFILLKPPNTSFDMHFYNVESGEHVLDYDGTKHVEDLYGTVEKPVVGKLYDFTPESIDTIITENMYKDVTDILKKNVTQIVFEDYFPDDIINNFKVSMNSNSDNSEIENKIESDKVIKFRVSQLKNKEEASFSYIIKIDDLDNFSLLDKTIQTNSKLQINYISIYGNTEESTITSSPAIRISEVKKQEPSPSPSAKPSPSPSITTKPSPSAVTPSPAPSQQATTTDPTVAQGKLPKAGKTMLIICSLSSLITIAIYLGFKNKEFKDIEL